MNKPIRRVAVAIFILFGLLLVNINYLQVVHADSLRSNPHNARVLLKEYERQRGAIVVDGTAVAKSVPTTDRLKYLRVYPNGPDYAHVTGFYSLVYGPSGIEHAKDAVLSGSSDQLITQRLSDLVSGHDPQGASVLLTLNAKAQQAATQGLAGKRGAVVALDPKTGAILAMASSPSYDPTKLSSHDPKAIRAYYAQLTANPAAPLLNRAIRQTYPPGSTFKVIDTAAALSTGKYTPQSVIPAPSSLQLPQSTAILHNFEGETCSPGGSTTLLDALRISCNTAYAKLGLTLGADALRSQAQAFGFGNAFTVPMRTVDSVFPEDVNRPNTALSAIGQYSVRMTPLQGAMIAAGIANDGIVMKPYLVDKVEAPDLSVLDSADPQQLSRAVSPEVAAQLTTMMEAVVDNGTGTAAQIPGITVAGKTGTADHGDPDKHLPPDAWFIAFAPAQDPTIAVAVLVEDGGQGGQTAAPIARAVMAAVLR